MIATKYPNRDAIYAAHTKYRDAMRRFIINFLKKNCDTLDQLLSKKLTRDPNDPVILNNETEATEAIDIDNFPYLIREFWASPISFCNEFNSDRAIWNEAELIKDGRLQWAHPGTDDTNSDVTLKQLLLVLEVLDKINAPDEKREVEVIRDRLFTQDIQELLEVKSNQLETAQTELIALQKNLATMEHRLVIAEADRTAAEEQLADISDIVAAESFREPSDDAKTADTSDQHLDSGPVQKRTKTLGTLKVGQWLNGTVKNITGFGAFVDLNNDVDGLIHKSEIVYERIDHPSDVVSIGENVKVKIIDINRENGKISLSLKRNPWVDSDVEKNYSIGSKVSGTVTNIKDFGVFLELEKGLGGMIHKSELSWKPHDVVPSDFNPGDKIEVVVLNISKEDKRISLGLKQLEPNPWELLKENYPVGTEIIGPVVNVTGFGVFVEIEPGINGLIRMSAPESLKDGDEVEAIISDINVERQEITLYLSTGQISSGNLDRCV